MGIYIPDIFLNGRCQNCPWCRVFDNAHYACDRYPWIGRFPMDSRPEECRIKEINLEDTVNKQTLIEWTDNWEKMNNYYHPNSKQRTIPIDEVKDIIERVPGLV